jgi:hypothetical protein
LVSFILIFRFVAHATNRLMWCCRRVDAAIGSTLEVETIHFSE